MFFHRTAAFATLYSADEWRIRYDGEELLYVICGLTALLGTGIFLYVGASSLLFKLLPNEATLLVSINFGWGSHLDACQNGYSCT